MNDLIEALQIFAKYGNPTWPTHCEHDILMIHCSIPEELEEDDRARVEQLGFGWSDEQESWVSYKFGSC